MTNPTDSEQPGMSAWGRVAFVIGLMLAFMATIYAAGELRSWLKQLVNGWPMLVRAATETALIAVWALPLLIFPKLRDVGSLRLPWTWTVLLMLPGIVTNLVFFVRLPEGLTWRMPLILVWYGLAIGVLEELVFRGYAFRGSPQTHPRLVVLTSATCFALAHFLNLFHETLADVLLNFPFVFALGLGLGVIRMASGSLAWCMLLHGAIDVSSEFSKTDGAYQKMYPFAAGTFLVATILTFCLHPKLRAWSARCDPSPKDV